MGIALAALIMFGAVITLLNHEHISARFRVSRSWRLSSGDPCYSARDHQVHYATIQTVSGQQVAQNGHSL